MDTVLGTVKFFGALRDGHSQGWGFIIPDGSRTREEEIFVHYSDVKSAEPDDFLALYAGERVECQIVDDEKGRRATNVEVLVESKKRLERRERVARIHDTA